jgi:dienelactone hydrolase
MQTRDIDYRDQSANLRGYLAWDETAAERRPGVLVFHEGLGLGEFAMARARMLAELGHVALAADMFGDRRQARNLEEAAKLIGELRNEPEALRARGRAALATLAALPQVDASRLAAIGFCSAVRWRWSSRAAVPISKPSSVSTVFSPPRCPRLPAR